MNEPFHAAFPATATVDLAAISANVGRLRELAGSAEVLAVVKADAYGHGILPVARAAQRGGASWLGVAQLAEAMTLRAAGVQGRILAWLLTAGPNAVDDLTRGIAADIDIAAGAPWVLDAAALAAQRAGRPARVHLKVDTGLARNGIWVGPALDAAIETAGRLQAQGLISVVGVMQHFAYADAPEHPTVRTQADHFADAVRAVEQAGFDLEVRHAANSAATLTNPSLAWDLVRPGIAMYGLSPVPDIAGPEHWGLTPAMRLTATLFQVKPVPAGQGISYGHTYTPEQDTLTGLVPLGYADGIPRAASNAGPVLVGGRRHTVAGRVCMDQFIVDLGPGATARAGDEVVLFGAGPGEPTAQDWAQAAGTISYEIVTRIAGGVPRRYVGGDD